MTSHKHMVVGGEPLQLFLARRHRDLVVEVLQTLVNEVPIYRRLPQELVDGDVRRVVEHALRLFAVSLAAPIDDQLTGLTDSATRRAEEGVPMDMVLAAYFHGSRVAAGSALAAARPEELADVRRLIDEVLRFMEQVCGAVAAGYERFARTSYAEQANARHQLVTTILAGHDARDAAGAAGVHLASTYLVAAVSTGTHPDEIDPDVDHAVAAQRKLRRLREELQRHYADPILWALSPDGGLALIADGDVQRFREVLIQVERIVGTTIQAGVEVTPVGEVPAGAEVAREVLEVARQLERPGGTYELSEVALEYHLRRPSPATRLLAARLAGLVNHPDLSSTLREFMATGMNRRRTASILDVHPNTVDNRLKRVASLTGLDPTNPADLPTIAAALAAHPSA